jgi:hypothetical protein
MKLEVCSRNRIASMSLAAALLMLSPALPVRAESNTTVVPSSNGATANAPSAGEPGKQSESGKPSGHKAAHPRKKKTSFMQKMRDKGMLKLQKLFGSKQQPAQAPKPESNLE